MIFINYLDTVYDRLDMWLENSINPTVEITNMTLLDLPSHVTSTLPSDASSLSLSLSLLVP